MKLCRPLRSVCLFSLFSHETKENLFIKFVLVKINKTVNEDLYLLNLCPKLYSVPLSRVNLSEYDRCVSGDPPAVCRNILGQGTDPVEQIATFAWQPLQSVYAWANVTSCVV